MHQIRFPLELRPTPHWWSLQCRAPRVPDPLTEFTGPNSKGREKGEDGETGQERLVKGREGERRCTVGMDLAHPKILTWRPYSSELQMDISLKRM